MSLVDLYIHVVMLPRNDDCTHFGESRSTAVREFIGLERSLRKKGEFEEFAQAVKEYFDMQHAEPVPDSCMNKPHEEVYHMPKHAVRKSARTIRKINVVFDASAFRSSGTNLNEQFMVGPMVHAPMLDILLRF